MESSFILGITTFVYMAATVFYVAYAVFRKEMMAKTGLITLVIAILANSAGIGLRWLETHQQGIGYVPLSNMYESLVFFALCIAVLPPLPCPTFSCALSTHILTPPPSFPHLPFRFERYGR